MFPFARFPGADPVLSPEMKTTGEVMGIRYDFDIAFAKSQLGGGIVLPDAGTVFVSVKDSDKPHILPAARAHGRARLHDRSRPAAPRAFLRGEGLPVERVNKVAQGRPHIVDRIVDGGVQLIFNTTEGWQTLKDSQSIRAAALKAQGALLHHGGGERGRRPTRSARCAGTRLKCARSKPIIRLRNADFPTNRHA